MSDTPKLPGLSRLSEEELREQYKTELAADAPADLSTRQGLIAAIQAHRDKAAPTTPPPADAPATALDALMPNGNQLSPESSEDKPDNLLVLQDFERLSRTLPLLNEETFGHLLDSVLTEAHERGIVTTDAPEADSTAKADGAPAPLVADEDHLIAVKDGEERRFTRTSWEIMKADRNGWVEKQDEPAKPKDLQ